MQSLFNVYKSWIIYKIIKNYIEQCKTIQENLFLFSLQVTEAFLQHSRTFMAGLFCETISQLKVVNYFCKRAQGSKCLVHTCIETSFPGA